MTYTKEETRAIADTAYRQLIGSIPRNVYWSWGVTEVAFCSYDDKPTLVLVVNGFLHQGPVFISYNGGQDLYEVRTVKNHTEKVEVLKMVGEVYAEDLGEVVDSLVEKGCSQEEYEKKVNQLYKS